MGWKGQKINFYATEGQIYRNSKWSTKEESTPSNGKNKRFVSQPIWSQN